MTTMQDSETHPSSMTALELISNAIPLLQEQERQHQARNHELNGGDQHHQQQQQSHHSLHLLEHQDETENEHQDGSMQPIEQENGVEDLLNHPQVHDRILQEEHMLQQHQLHAQQLHAQQLEQLGHAAYPMQDNAELSQEEHHMTGHEQHGHEGEQDVDRDERTLAEIALDSQHEQDPHLQQSQQQQHAQHDHEHHPSHLEPSLEMLGADPNTMPDGYGISLRDPQRLVELPGGLPLPLPLELDPGSMNMQDPQAGPSSVGEPSAPSMFIPISSEGLQVLGEFEPMEFETFDELYEAVAGKAREHGFSVSIYNPTRSKKGVLRAANLRCSKSGKHRETRTNETRRRKAHTSKTDCPFNIYAHRTDPISNKFTFFVKSGEHNHLPDYSKSGKPIRRKIRSGPIVVPGGTVNAAGTGGGAEVEVAGETVPRAKKAATKGKAKGKGKGKVKAKMLDEEASLLAGLQDASSATYGMEMDHHDPNGLGGMGGMMDGVEDGFVGLDTTTLGDMGGGMQDALDEDGRDRDRDRHHQHEHESGPDHDHGGYQDHDHDHGHEDPQHQLRHYQQEHQHHPEHEPQDDAPSSHDHHLHLNHASHPHSHHQLALHSSYVDADHEETGLAEHPNLSIDPAFQSTMTTDTRLGSSYGVHRGSKGIDNVSDLRTRREVGMDGSEMEHDEEPQLRHHEHEHEHEHGQEGHDPLNGMEEAGEGEEQDLHHYQQQRHEMNPDDQPAEDQLEMSLNGAMDAAAAAAGMGMEMSMGMMEMGMGMGMNFLGQSEDAGVAPMEPYASELEQPDAEHETNLAEGQIEPEEEETQEEEEEQLEERGRHEQPESTYVPDEGEGLQPEEQAGQEAAEWGHTE